MKKWLILGLFWCSALLHGAMLEADKEITMGILPNGMKYYIQENPYPAKTGLFYLRVDSGSSDERDDELGLAHLVEHMAFNGSRDFSKNDLIRNLESFGVLFGADLNAYTTYDSTAYHLKVAIDPKNLDNTFRIFHNWMDGVSFEAEELEKERGVVMAEERTRNTPQYRLFIQRMKQLVAGSIYENRAPIGDMEIIKNVSAKKIKSFYERIYQPRFMSFVAVGDFDKNEIERRIKETFAQVKNTNDYQHPDKTIPVKSGMQLYNYDTSELGIDSVQIAFCDSFRAQKDEESVRETLLNSYITILINQIYQKKNALIKAKFTARPLQYQQMIYSFDANVLQDDFKNSLGDVWGVLEGIRRFGFNQNHFEDAKKTLLGIVRMAYEQSRKRNSENLSKNIIEHIDSDATLLSPLAFRDLRLKLLDEITPKEVNERFRHILNLPAKSISLYSQKGIKLSAQEWKQIQSTATVFNTQESDKILPQSLISTPITPKKILKKELDKKSQITVLTLENGAKVILKPLKMTSSTVLFSAFSPGGTSVLENPRLGSFSVTLPNESGVGDFNAYEMAKIISGKPISYSRFIEPLSHGLRGKSSASDLETLLQAIHLEFSAPRTDPKTLEQIKTKTIEALKKSQDLPEIKFEREYINFLYQNNERTRPLAISDVEGVQLASLRSILAQHFSNAADFTFVFVGDINEAKLEPLIKKYLATLPSSKPKARFLDDGVRSLAGIHLFERHYQTSPKASISIVIKNENAKYSKKDRHKIKALAAILQQILREEIREEQGDTYGFSVRFALKSKPYEHSKGIIAFECAPHRAKPIIAQIEGILARIQKEGVESRLLDNYKKATILKAKRDAELPKFWMGNITSHILYGTELFNLSEYQTLVNSFTLADMKEGAKMWLKWHDVVVSINLPQAKK